MEEFDWRQLLNALAIIVPVATAAAVAWIQKRKSPEDAAAVSASTMSTMTNTIRSLVEELETQRDRMRELEKSMRDAEEACEKRIDELEQVHKRARQGDRDRINSLKERVRVLEQNGSKQA